MRARFITTALKIGAPARGCANAGHRDPGTTKLYDRRGYNPEDGRTLSEGYSNTLAPGSLPDLWTDDSVTVADAVAYFAGGRTVIVQREGYEESVVIPACSPVAVEMAISDAVVRIRRLRRGRCQRPPQPSRMADLVTKGAAAAGVSELIDRVIATDLAEVRAQRSTDARSLLKS